LCHRSCEGIFDPGERRSAIGDALDDQVIAGTIRDRVLGSQLKAGFHVRAILPNYLRDARSGNFATLLEWQSPDAIG
jgi:hypothetical protein